MPTTDNTTEFATAPEIAYQTLTRVDPVLAGLIARHGTPNPFVWDDGGRTGSSNFAAMSLHIIGQQINMTVASLLYERLCRKLGDIPTPAGILTLSPDTLRSLGLSRAKGAYLTDLAARVSAGALDIERMDHLTDAQAVQALTEVRGVGQWSAEMFLIHQIHRGDVLPAGDVGIRRAIQHGWQLSTLPSIEQVRAQGAEWAPYRSYAAALLWRSLTTLNRKTKP